MNIYVGNLSQNTTEADLAELFKKYGSVDTTKIIKDFTTGNSKGFGFVEMEERGGAEAVKELNGQELHGNGIIVNEARPKADNRGSERSNGGGQRRRSW